MNDDKTKLVNLDEIISSKNDDNNNINNNENDNNSNNYETIQKDNNNISNDNENSNNIIFQKENSFSNENNKNINIISSTIENGSSSLEPFYSMKAIYCTIHKFEFLKIDSSSFDIFCLKCKQNNNSNGQENLHFILNKSEIKKFYKKNRKLSSNEITCFKHKNEKCSFYCDECKEFICKFCFAEEHRNHYCHLPEKISNDFKIFLNEIINNSKELNPELEKTIEEVKKIYDNLKQQKNEVLKIPKNTIDKITQKNVELIENLLKKFENNINNLDNDANDNLNKILKFQENCEKYLKEISIIKNNLNNQNNINNNNETNNENINSDKNNENIDEKNSNNNNLNEETNLNESNSNKLENNNEKIISSEINENNINNKKIDFNKMTSIEICEYHQKNFNLFTEIKKFIEKSTNYLNNKLKNNLLHSEENKNIVKNNINLLNKEIINYENSSINSIATGQKSNSILLKRFIRFMHNEIKYFKNTSLIIVSNKNIFITGLSLCGLYTNKKINIDENIIKENDSFQIKTPLPLKLPDENKNLNLKINISLIKSHTIITSTPTDNTNNEQNINFEYELLYSEDFYSKEIYNKFDPSFNIYFREGVKISKNLKYLITIENLSEITYCDLWIGSIGKLGKKGVQTCLCHNTKTEFNFIQTNGIQTDFDEFNNGIIEGILYTTN